ncbi:MAG: hypothetical protein ACTHMI_13395 [Mucilaginibacter sp.]
MSKKIVILVVICLFVKLSYGQVQYTVNQVAYGTLTAQSEPKIGEFKSIKLFKANLFSNALTFDEGFDGAGNTYYKFVRKIYTGDESKQRWNALDRYNRAVEITIKDYNSYSLIAIKDIDTNKLTVYKTL